MSIEGKMGALKERLLWMKRHEGNLKDTEVAHLKKLAAELKKMHLQFRCDCHRRANSCK
ncbi:hypothetical protein [Wolinella succinogenes]|uniref:hypothetical protein n=1 Tax=Wolinella succinogenes TaxID=844 RepID=UPI00030DA376|nr:hypothetical protein [Wolinella succinogenes]NLU34690.1 hypothetical protein [Wolinella succinogenes]VEG80911.1 Uncharacterised protein [Wolinella succinogenes]